MRSTDEGKSSKGVRWHPLIIRWAVNLHMTSTATYYALQSSGFLRLPSERKLRDYTNFFRREPGFQPELNDLLEEANLDSPTSIDKHVILVFDEMHIKEDLVPNFDKHRQDITGFVDLGNVNNKIATIKDSLRSGAKSAVPRVATQMLVLMASWTSCGKQWNSLKCCDKASSNRKFFRMQGSARADAGEADTIPTYKIPNPYTEEKRNIDFVSDACHLIKTTRNCLWSSLSATNRRMHLS